MEVRLKEEFTYSRYLQLKDDIRYEVIEGDLIRMEPSPDSEHQSISGAIFLQIGNHLTGKPCKIFSAPFDVVLKNENDDAFDSKNVVQPDLLVVCDVSKIQKVCIGAPDLIIEILSKSSAHRDMITKKNLYERYAVPEYWIVDPERRMIMVFRLEDGRYRDVQFIPEGEPLIASVLSGLVLDTAKIFA